MKVAIAAVLTVVLAGCVTVTTDTPAEVACKAEIERQVDAIQAGADPNAPEYWYTPPECQQFSDAELVDMMNEMGYEVEDTRP